MPRTFVRVFKIIRMISRIEQDCRFSDLSSGLAGLVYVSYENITPKLTGLNICTVQVDWGRGCLEQPEAR
jgi:hypothetical protein